MARETRETRRISEALLDELLAGQDPAVVFRDGTLIDDLKKAVAERALEALRQVSGNVRQVREKLGTPIVPNGGRCSPRTRG